MNAEKKDHVKNDGAWKAVLDAFNTEVPEHLEKQLKKNLNGFRQDIREHPYVRRPERRGFPLRRKLMFFSQPALGSAFPVGRHGIGRCRHCRVLYFGKQSAHMGGGARTFWLHAFFCRFNL